MTATERISMVIRSEISEKRKISQTVLAQKMGVSAVAVNKWLNGGSIAVDRIPDLCRALDLTPNELFGFENPVARKGATELYDAFQKYPEYQDSIIKLLGLIEEDLKEERE